MVLNSVKLCIEVMPFDFDSGKTLNHFVAKIVPSLNQEFILIGPSHFTDKCAAQTRTNEKMFAVKSALRALESQGQVASDLQLAPNTS
jgi:hypothetical protein